MWCVGGVVKKLHARQDISGSSSGLHIIFFTLHMAFCPGSKTGMKGGFGTGTKACFCSSERNLKIETDTAKKN